MRVAAVCLAGLLSVALGVAGTAHAEEPVEEPDTSTLICQQLKLGQEPGALAEDLHRGDPRYSLTDTIQTVLESSWACND